ncbi:hypothetical protein E4U03_09510 [Rothia nasimurium]|uniref:XRE family transcriptional regulator n=1 Tax=Rothia nasimurium TaxID=85336 RepID=A0A4Y9F1W7_9MICC|nr:hypothetical protein [Rothia nasimurium]MBF0808836.1 hypothetical protein [Rothia nasimurium]TFU21282.1 hypothetical protein E4U03_09510 [Rothia nasimurium]
MAQEPHFNPRVLDRIKYEAGIHKWNDLAILLGVSYTKLKNWREGKSTPSFAETILMSYRFRIPIQDMTVETYEEILEMAKAA